ncbi:hypothetical protein ACJMK2_022823 [Sinanodonta woodiana]|uniref:Uncharacterized protein n=1 Tax=Sinanodonta woodiana TaxID=1069815 RepID=A0ABD3TK72_SINWO
MAESLRKEDNLSKSPVILHQNMTDPDYAKILTTYSYSVRESESIIPDTVIFPLSRVAFLIVPLNSCLSGSGQLDIKEDLVQRIDKFIQVHRNRYILCQASTFAEQECQAFSFIQQQYLKNRLQLLPCHNAEEGVKAMITIAKLLCRPTCQEMNSRLQHLLAQQLKKDSATEFLKQMGLSDHHILYIDYDFFLSSHLDEHGKNNFYVDICY